MEKEEFEKLVADAVDDLPDEFREKLENVNVVVEEYPSRALAKKMNLKSPKYLLGLYQGVPQNRRGWGYSMVMPDKISIYKNNIEGICKTDEEIKSKVKEVVIHEIGHHFGLSELQIRKAMNEI